MFYSADAKTTRIVDCNATLARVLGVVGTAARRDFYRKSMQAQRNGAKARGVGPRAFLHAVQAMLGTVGGPALALHGPDAAVKVLTEEEAERATRALAAERDRAERWQRRHSGTQA